jgi:hypothetical protein
MPTLDAFVIPRFGTEGKFSTMNNLRSPIIWCSVNIQYIFAEYMNK